MAKTISVKVEGTADFQAVSRRLQQVFAATGREAQSAADKVEGQFERAAAQAQSSALKISRAFAGVNDDLSNVGDGFDAKALAGRIEAAFGRISTSNLLDAAGIDADIPHAVAGTAGAATLTRNGGTAAVEAPPWRDDPRCVEAGAAAASKLGQVVSVEVIPRPHEELSAFLPKPKTAAPAKK